ncbi:MULTISPECIES: hypothetical protein [Novosphingobium]|uniref:hypothetical protein n=1 Tax=Novosphingobium TaxID=165696 RepID=UPI0005A2F53F|nr:MULTISPECIES: hypothetical protein [Novosphingobium]
MTRRMITVWVAAVSLLLAVLPTPAAANAGYTKTVGNVLIYLGIIPAEIVRGLHSSGHTERTMHGGTPKGSDEYHVTIALFDAKTGERISRADVRARVAEIGMYGEEKELQPMEIAGTETFGNYFPMQGDGPFRIYVTIRLPGRSEAISTRFEHWHR